MESAFAELLVLLRTTQAPACLDWHNSCIQHGFNGSCPKAVPPSHTADYMAQCITETAPGDQEERRRSPQFRQCMYITRALAGYSEIGRAYDEVDEAYEDDEDEDYDDEPDVEYDNDEDYIDSDFDIYTMPPMARVLP